MQDGGLPGEGGEGGGSRGDMEMEMELEDVEEKTEIGRVTRKEGRRVYSSFPSSSYT